MENSKTIILKAAAKYYNFLKKQNNDKKRQVTETKKVLRCNDKKD